MAIDAHATARHEMRHGMPAAPHDVWVRAIEQNPKPEYTSRVGRDAPVAKIEAKEI
jgi:hypothetical protein